MKTLRKMFDKFVTFVFIEHTILSLCVTMMFLVLLFAFSMFGFHHTVVIHGDGECVQECVR